MKPMLFLAALVAACQAQATEDPALLYILLDGFRWNYVDDPARGNIPGFDRLLEEGVRAEWVNPIFPSLSYPSWTTLSTGLYAESHGIVGNYFYDPTDNTTFSLFDANATGNPKWWTNIEPIWTTATKNNLNTSLYLWGRCDVVFDGVLPQKCEHFVKITGPEVFRNRTEQALQDLEDGFKLVQVYTEHVDTTGHAYGPESEETRQAVRDLDETIVYLLDELDARNLTDKVNIVIVSDHGMTDTDPEKIGRIELDEYLPDDGIDNIADKGAFSNILLNSTMLAENSSLLDSAVESFNMMEGVTAYKKAEIPDAYHYKDSPYIHDIVLTSDVGTWFTSSNDTAISLPERDFNYTYMGGHGYRPDVENMRSIFFARGPAFKENYTISPINIVDIYHVLTKVLEIDPVPNNGTMAHIEDAFDSSSIPPVSSTLIFLASVFTAARTLF